MLSSAAEIFVLETSVFLLHSLRLGWASDKILLLAGLSSVSFENQVLSPILCTFFFFLQRKINMQSTEIIAAKNTEYDPSKTSDNL